MNKQDIKKMQKEAQAIMKEITTTDKGKVTFGDSFILSYGILEKSYPKLAACLLNNPEEAMTILYDELDKFTKHPCMIRFMGLPESCNVKIRDIRAKHLNKMISIGGYLMQASDVRPQVVTAKFECPKCGTIISVLQIEKKFREPSRCSCGRRGQFRLISKEMVDAQRIIVAEDKYNEKGEPVGPILQVFLKEDLTSPDFEILESIGKKIMISGILREIPVYLDTGDVSTRFDIAVEANNLRIFG